MRDHAGLLAGTTAAQALDHAAGMRGLAVRQKQHPTSRKCDPQEHAISLPRFCSQDSPFHFDAAKPIVLHLGEDIKYNHDYHESIFTERFTVVANEEPDRASFIAAFNSIKYGDFSAIFRPHFQSGGEIGQWDDELIPLLPPSIRILASAGAGFN
ncbi:hypothetical protein Cob_v005534 [Colletotrichum orbiculare MAFF 240422]|uniref:Uncharacterized protein n=1 Tax=Colletotrichum orbiculare (strain 104-T / ATCC 96160 / CBS 514.97 / LARS 414 / MAFF 240422) TaxID=1213857 RepID=A0A484FT69_COLOR|nr:hypothetical protein Cob_v005534 [Colletotrichum orbiculare MAFF 240422]